MPYDRRGLLHNDRRRSCGGRRRLRPGLEADDRLARGSRRCARARVGARRRCGRRRQGQLRRLGRRQGHLRRLGRVVHLPRIAGCLRRRRPGRPADAPARVSAVAAAGALVAPVAGTLVAAAVGRALVAAAAVARALVAAVAPFAGALVAPLLAVPGVGLIGMGHAGRRDRDENARDCERRADEHRCSPAGGPMGWQLRRPAHGSDAGSQRAPAGCPPGQSPVARRARRSAGQASPAQRPAVSSARAHHPALWKPQRRGRKTPAMSTSRERKLPVGESTDSRMPHRIIGHLRGNAV
ncbi:MAG: hypothetical protein QOI17_1550, partial [Gaiellales bacterium]|nr:hypothetical protein [Gaiellales bacterium]